MVDAPTPGARRWFGLLEARRSGSRADQPEPAGDPENADPGGADLRRVHARTWGRLLSCRPYGARRSVWALVIARTIGLATATCLAIYAIDGLVAAVDRYTSEPVRQVQVIAYQILGPAHRSGASDLGQPVLVILAKNPNSTVYCADGVRIRATRRVPGSGARTVASASAAFMYPGQTLASILTLGRSVGRYGVAAHAARWTDRCVSQEVLPRVQWRLSNSGFTVALSNATSDRTAPVLLVGVIFEPGGLIIGAGEQAGTSLAPRGVQQVHVAIDFGASASGARGALYEELQP